MLQHVSLTAHCTLHTVYSTVQYCSVMYTHYSTSHCVLSAVLSRVESISITKGQNIKGDNTQNIRVIYLLLLLLLFAPNVKGE